MSVNPNVSRHLRGLLLKWLAQDQRRTEVDFAKAAGLSKATVNNIKNKAEGGGSRTVRGFAKALGISPLEIYAAAEGATPLSAFTLQSLPGWEDLRAKVSVTSRGRTYSEEAWRAAGNTPVPTVIRLDEYQVQQLVEWWHTALLLSRPDSDLKAS